MGGKKKSSSKKKTLPAPAKYVAAPVEPVKTRSASSKSKSSALGDTPTSSPGQSADSVGVVPTELSLATIQKSLEDRFDERMAHMETNFRASIASAISSSTLAGAHSTASTLMPPPTQAPPRVSRTTGRDSTRSPSRSSARSTSSRVSRSASSRSSRSSTRSSSGHRRHHHHHSRSRSRQPKHSKYSSARYLKDKQKLNTYERLVLVNVKMAMALLKRGKDISGFLGHFLMIAEKADKDVFEPEALINYDESVKELAKESGISAFAEISPSLIVKHLSYDGTRNARSAKAAQAKTKFKPAQAGRKGPAGSYCIKHNFDPSGCPRGKDCPYKHICSACYGSGHISDNCPNTTKQK